MIFCLICKGEVKELLNLGKQPVCNRLLKNPQEEEFTHPLLLGQCSVCGLIQLMQLFPIEEVELRQNLIMYSEPEDHLDELAADIKKLVGKDASVLGLSFKDATLIKRLSNLGLHAKVLDPKLDLGLKGFAGPELVQNKLSQNFEYSEKFDVVVARHIFEHVYNPHTFLKNLQNLLKPNGLILLEVPDCSQALETFDYSVIWEEHTLYFTENTFKKSSGLNIQYFKKYFYPLEGSLVAIGKPGVSQNIIQNTEFKVGAAFAHNFSLAKEQALKIPNKVAFFGAGHLACVYINIFGIKDKIEFVMDDNPEKKGMFMPGSKIPIVGSDMLKSSNISTCVLSINPRNEQKVAHKHAYFTEKGGKFLSIFPSSMFATSLIQESPEVIRSTDKIVLVDDNDIKIVEQLALKSTKRRCRICAHSNEEKIHEMLISIAHDSYIRPHRHIGKSESFHVIRGEADIVLFNEQGHIIRVISLGPPGSDKKFYYRISEPIYHTVLVKTPLFTFHEITNGPFDKKETEQAPWAPDEQNLEAKAYLEKLRGMILTQ